MHYHYKCTVSYDGTKYNGWQHQNNTPNTVQAAIETALSDLLQQPGAKNTSISVNGSGRTDAGVHAFGQCFDFFAEKNLDFADFLRKINLLLPDDIRILSIEKADKTFHARKSARGKIYQYYIDIRQVPCVFTRKYAYQLNRNTSSLNQCTYSTNKKETCISLNVEAMHAAAKSLCGTHDYTSFTSDKRSDISYTRTIYSISISKQNNYLILEYYGNGFLYNMVRILTGTLIEVGLGKITAADIPGILDGKNRQLAGFTAPGYALFLKKVLY